MGRPTGRENKFGADQLIIDRSRYLFVNDTLVAPIMMAQAAPEQRRVWIPPGEWIDACNGGGHGAAGLSCAEAAAAMAVVAMRTEPECTVMCFSHVFSSFPLTKSSSLLSDAMRHAHQHNFGATDCSLPVQ